MPLRGKKLTLRAVKRFILEHTHTAPKSQNRDSNLGTWDSKAQIQSHDFAAHEGQLWAALTTVLKKWVWNCFVPSPGGRRPFSALRTSLFFSLVQERASCPLFLAVQGAAGENRAHLADHSPAALQSENTVRNGDMLQ